MAAIYLTQFTFPSEKKEEDGLWNSGMREVYPFHLLSGRGLGKIALAPVTILHGGNGSGKSTALNVIAEKLGLQRDSIFHKSRYFLDYAALCEAETAEILPKHSRIITSDDVFDYMLEIRSLNEGVDLKREDIHREYLDAKYTQFKVRSMADYEELRKVNETRRKTQTQFTKERLREKIRELSNGESAFGYFTNKIGESAFYILDEPENSLSPERQMALKQFIEDSVRFFGCQFLLSTHSPFLLAMPGAKIYDLDAEPACVRRWTELENVKIYREFFMRNEDF